MVNTMKVKVRKLKLNKTFLRLICVLLCLGFLGMGAVLGINAIVKGSVAAAQSGLITLSAVYGT